jgi:hypothetical protein
MPNHCGNLLRIHGPDKELRRFAKAAQGLKADGEALDLTRFFPEPKELQGIHSGGCTINGKQYSSWREDDKGNNIAIPDWELRSLKKRFGATSMYDWHCNVLGTKWGVYDVEANYGNGSKGPVLEYTFHTAWSPFATSVLIKMSELYPKLNFVYKFAEQGCGFMGMLEAEGGDIIDEFKDDTKDKCWHEKKGECNVCGEEIEKGNEDCHFCWDPAKFTDPEFIDLLNVSG